MDENIRILLKAIDAIDQNSVYYKHIDDYLCLNERAFAYELYSKWTEALKDNNPSKLRVNAEISKRIEDNYSIIMSTIFGKEKNKWYFYPDMVLHAGQGNGEQQKIICEIKYLENSDQDNVTKDFMKMLAYMTNKALRCDPYEYGVFILVDGCVNQLKELIDIKKIKNMNDIIRINDVDFNGKYGNIYCISYKVDHKSGKKEKLEIIKLTELIPEFIK